MCLRVIMSRLKKSVIDKIYKAYFDLYFPGSFQSIAKFQEALARKLDIKVTRKTLRKILKDNAYYQTNVTRPKKFLTRKFQTHGVGLLGYCDPVYIQLPNKKIFKFLVVCDAMSKFCYAQHLAEVNPKELKKAFQALFRQGMPYFAIVKVDKDRSLGTLANNFFANRHVLLSQRRSKAHMMFLEPIKRTLKKKLIQNFRKHPDQNDYSDAVLKKNLRQIPWSKTINCKFSNL